MPKLSLTELKKAVNKADLVIFDITRINEKTKEDVSLLKMFGLKASEKSVFGPVADKLKSSVKVVGGSRQTDLIEFDRQEGTRLAEECGLAIPQTHEFDNLSKGAAFLKDRKDLWVFKPFDNQDLDLTYVEKFAGELHDKLTNQFARRLTDKCRFLLQKKIAGTEVSTEAWFGPAGAVHCNHTIENKRLMDGDLGPAIGSQSNTVFASPQIPPFLSKAASNLPGYIGPVDVNTIVSDGRAYFLEWTPRFGYDALYCLLTLSKDSITDFFIKDFVVSFSNGYAVSQRISIPPYPVYDKRLLKEWARDVAIESQLEKTPFFWAQDVYSDAGKLRCAAADGILGVVTSKADSLDAAWGTLYHNINRLKIGSYVQFRQDGFKQAAKRLKGIKDASVF